MLIDASATLSFTVTIAAVQSDLGSGHSSRAEPSPPMDTPAALLPLSSLLVPTEPSQSASEPSSSSRSSMPGSGTPPPPKSPTASSNMTSSDVGNQYIQYTSPSSAESAPTPSPTSSSFDTLSSSMSGNTGTSMGTSLPPSSYPTLTSSSDVPPSPSSLPSSVSGISISGSASLTSAPLTTADTTSSGLTTAPVPLSSASFSLSTSHSTISMTIFTFTFTPTSVLSLMTGSTTHTFPSPIPISSSSSLSLTSSPSTTHTSSSPTYTSPSATTPSQDTTDTPTPTTVLVSTTVWTTVTPSTGHTSAPYTSIYTVTSVLPGNKGTATLTVMSSGLLSTDGSSNAVAGNLTSPGTIVALILGIIGAFAFAALWLFCARRRHRKLQDAALLAPEHQGPGPLEGEVLDGDDFGYGGRRAYGNRTVGSRCEPVIEQRYAGILAALHAGEGLGPVIERGSTGGVYGSHRDGATDMDGDMNNDIARASSPTLPLYALPPEDSPYAFPLSPPPLVTPTSYQQTAPPAPPSAYLAASRRRSSPGPDASAWFGGYSIAPSCNSHYAYSQTMGSGSGSGSVDALTRTRTGSEEPLLGIGRASELSHGPPLGAVGATAATGRNRLGLGSAFGSPEGSMYSPSASAVYPGLQGDTSGSYDARSASGSGSYGYTRSGTPSSFDVLRSVSSQGALSSAYSHGQGQSQGFRFGFGGSGSASSGSTGKKRGRYRHSFGNPPTSFRAWKERGSAGSEKEKESHGEKEKLKEKDWRRSTGSSTSASASGSGSADEKHGRTSPGLGVRALLGRLRRAGHTPSPRSSSRDLPSPPLRGSPDLDLEKTVVERVTPPPQSVPPIHVQVVTPQRVQYSYVLSNPDPHPPSPYSGTKDVDVQSYQLAAGGFYKPHDAPLYNPHDVPYAQQNTGGLHPMTTLPPGYTFGQSLPSPVPTEESRLAEGLLHPRLRVEGRSDASLRDFEDYSRPIGGHVNRMYSTTTFGTLDDGDTGRGTPMNENGDGVAENSHEPVDVFGATPGIPRESWFVDEDPQNRNLGLAS